MKTPITPLSKPRIESLDLLRGFALLGILLMNITSFSNIGMGYLNPLVGAGIEGYNKHIWNFNFLFADTRFMSMFSILFGAGVVLFSNNIKAKGLTPWKWHYKRMFFLLLFGMMHAYLIWVGDILVAYSICGALVFLLRNKSIRTLWIIGTILFFVPVLFGLATYFGMPPDQLQAEFSFWTPTQTEINEEITAYTGSYMDQMGPRIKSAIEMQTLIFLIQYLWRASSMMILGMILFRKGILSAERSISFYKKMTFGGILSGLIISGIGLYQAYQMNWNGPYMMNIGDRFNYVASLLMALGYIGLICWLYKSKVAQKAQALLQKVGRMAFTNYILSSVICTFIFYGHGLGLFGTFDRLQSLGVVVGVWVVLLLLSSYVMNNYRFGPLEWLWRKLTYLGMKQN